MRGLALVLAAGAALLCLAGLAQAQQQVAPKLVLPVQQPRIPRIAPPPPLTPPPPAPLPPVPSWPTVVFEGATFDVTGAGQIDLGDLDTVLGQFRRDFRNGEERMPLEFTVDAIGAIIGCEAQGGPRLELAGQTLCAHALANGRFTQNPLLVLDYTQATYRMTARLTSGRLEPGQAAFYTNAGYPHQRMGIQFGTVGLPPSEERLALSDVRIVGMNYPSSALLEGLEARVELLLTFNETGRVATCRPLSSTQTARMAYETCYQARRGARLYSPADDRPLVFAVHWAIPD
jgi:hypothetical protein